jgi:hypothetical protein
MDPDRRIVQDAVLVAKTTTIMEAITRLDKVQFAISTLMALREKKKIGLLCNDGCGNSFSVSFARFIHRNRLSPGPLAVPNLARTARRL